MFFNIQTKTWYYWLTQASKGMKWAHIWLSFSSKNVILKGNNILCNLHREWDWFLKDHFKKLSGQLWNQVQNSSGKSPEEPQWLGLVGGQSGMEAFRAHSDLFGECNALLLPLYRTLRTWPLSSSIDILQALVSVWLLLTLVVQKKSFGKGYWHKMVRGEGKIPGAK